MKLMPFFIFAILSLFTNNANAYDDTKLHAIITQLGIKPIELAYETELFDTPHSHAWVIVVKVSGDFQDQSRPKVYAIHTIVTDESDNILAHIEDKKEFEDNLWEVKIDTANYRLDNNTRAFGVRLTTKRSSQEFESSNETISLLTFKNNSLRKILSDLQVYNGNKYGVSENTCTGNWNETSTILVISNHKTKGFNDIIAKTTIESYKRGISENIYCKDKMEVHDKSSKTLKFNGDVYE
jgi:hypothetical protein